MPNAETPHPPIPAEAIEAAADAVRDANEECPWSIPCDRQGCPCRAMARAALTAAAPLLAGWRKLEGEPDPTKAPWDGDPVDLWDIYRQAREPMMRFDGCHYFVSQDKTHRTSWKCFGFYMRVPVPPAEGTP